MTSLFKGRKWSLTKCRAPFWRLSIPSEESGKSWEPSWSVRAPVYHTPSANLSWECFVNCHGNPLGHGDPISELQIGCSVCMLTKCTRLALVSDTPPFWGSQKREGNMATSGLNHSGEIGPLTGFDSCTVLSVTVWAAKTTILVWPAGQGGFVLQPSWFSWSDHLVTPACPAC